MSKTRIIIFLSFCLLFFLLGRGCRDKTQRAQDNIDAIRDSIMMYQVQAGYYGVELTKAERMIAELTKGEREVKKELVKKEAVITVQQKRIRELSTAVILTPGDSKECDSLAWLAGNLSDEVTDYKNIVYSMVSVSDSLREANTSAIEALKNQLKECNDVIVYSGKKLPEIKKDIKARNQVYVGVTAFGNALTPVGGVGLIGTIAAKNGVIYEVGAIRSRGQAWAMAGIKMRLSLKK